MSQIKEIIEPIDYLQQKLEKFTGNGASIGLVLFVSAATAMVIANSSWGADWYHHFWEQEITISLEDRHFSMDLHHLINDGLMSIFFFMIGLEIKREFLLGSLNTWKKASLPIGAAIGGMIAPALLYLAFTSGSGKNGWGIPMATDIAFTLGLINLVRNRIAKSLNVFVTSLAAVDDIGAVLVIALFYTSNLHLEQLYVAGAVLIFLLIANRLGLRSVLFYAFAGISGIWMAFFYAGIHPTIAGILLAFTIPARTRITRRRFMTSGRRLFNAYDRTKNLDDHHNSSKEDHFLEEMEHLSDDARAPLQKIESGLHHFVYFIIMPIFAFSNAGVEINGDFFTSISSGIGLGVIIGLVAGKVLGISIFSRLLVALRIAEMPEGSDWKQIIGVSFLAGTGFTMSIFIAELAFQEDIQIAQAKTAVLVASTFAATIGIVILGSGKIKTAKRPS